MLKLEESPLLLASLKDFRACRSPSSSWGDGGCTRPLLPPQFDRIDLTDCLPGWDFPWRRDSGRRWWPGLTGRLARMVVDAYGSGKVGACPCGKPAKAPANVFSFCCPPTSAYSPSSRWRFKGVYSLQNSE